MKEKGITLIALIVTIIVLIILAGITIATLTREDGITNNANNAKEETEIANEKEIVDRATINAMGNNKRGNIVKDELQDELDRITKVGNTEDDKNNNKFENCYFLKSDTVQKSAGSKVTVNASMLDNLTDTTINELNSYISNNSSLTYEWKKWTLGSNGYPIFI